MTRDRVGMPLEERLLGKMDVDPSGCWEWNAGRNRKGYGNIKVAGKDLRAHRVAYEVWVDLIPDGMQVMHICDNPPCINPDHLRVGTNKDNADDRDAKGRQRVLRGEENGFSKLTWENVQEIRDLYGDHTQAELARMYGVSPRTIMLVRTNQAWREK